MNMCSNKCHEFFFNFGKKGSLEYIYIYYMVNISLGKFFTLFGTGKKLLLFRALGGILSLGPGAAKKISWAATLKYNQIHTYYQKFGYKMKKDLQK